MKLKIKSPTRFKERLAGKKVKSSLLFVFILFFMMSIALSEEHQHSQIIVQTFTSESDIDSRYPEKNLNQFVSVKTDNQNDMDNDGLTNEEEFFYKTNPKVADSDGDYLLDGEEVHVFKTNPRVVDSDYDYICDYLEIYKTNTNPISSDSDLDGIVDGFEVYIHGSNPNSPDSDGDGLSDYDEGYIYHTNMLLKDTDNDGLMDGDEILVFLTNPCSSDTDGDGFSDIWEISNGQDPLVPDNLNKFNSLSIIVPTIGVVILFIGIFASVRTQRFQKLSFKTEYEKRIKSEEDKKYLFDLLCSFPSNQELNIEEVANKAECSIETIHELLQNLFADPDKSSTSEFSINDCIIHANFDSKVTEYSCFYCKTGYSSLENHCPYCLEEIVRCKLCKTPVACNDQYTTCASCGVFGRENNITGFLFIDHICESCMFSNRYNVV